MNEFCLKYSKSAVVWEEALPLGNGRLGMMVFGRGKEEIIRLNEETLWEGFEYDWDNPETKEYLPVIRKLIFEGEYSKAQEIALKKHVCKNRGSDKWHPGEPFGTFRGAGDLLIYDNNSVNFIERSLDIKNGVAYTKTDRYVRTHFTSLNENVIVIRIECENNDLDISFRFDHNGGEDLGDAHKREFANDDEKRFWHYNEITKDFNKTYECVKVEDNSFFFEEQLLGEGAMKWAFLCRIDSDGDCSKLTDGVRVSNARVITAYVSIATTYNSADPAAVIDNNIENAVNIGYDALFDAHKKEFASIMMRSELSLENDKELMLLDTDKRLERFKQGEEDIGLYELYFNYGKYLLVSSSKNGCTLPANLQGIWTKDSTPPWSSDYHININLQMNYWPSEVTGLADCADSLFKYIKFLQKHGKKTAEIMYGCGGWVAHHATTPHGFTSAGNNPIWGSFVCSGAWCVTHLFEHYRYSLDKEFLKEYWNTITECAKFFLDYLVKDPKTGYYVTCPSSSPENSFIDDKTGQRVGLCAGTTMDTQIIYDLFSGILEFAQDAEENDKDFLNKIKEYLDNLSPMKIGKHGNIMEWTEDYEEFEPGHRHISHLYGLFPSNQINSSKPELFEAAKKTIERRLSYGGGHTGWSKAWIINMYNRLFDGEQAKLHLDELLKKCTTPNLFDIHPPFQIDGNFGGCNAIAGMLMYDSGEEIVLLPALPESWKNGYFKGFCAKGRKKVSCTWKNGKVIESKVENI